MIRILEILVWFGLVWMAKPSVLLWVKPVETGPWRGREVGCRKWSILLAIAEFSAACMPSCTLQLADHLRVGQAPLKFHIQPKAGEHRGSSPHSAACGVTCTALSTEEGAAVTAHTGASVPSWQRAFSSTTFLDRLVLAFTRMSCLRFLWIPTSRKWGPHLCYNEKTLLGEGM